MEAHRRLDRIRADLCGGGLSQTANPFLDYGRALSDDRRMDTIEEYKIIESEDLDSLAKKVNAALKEGWQPHGAPFIHVSGGAVVCCQAIVDFHRPTSAETVAKLRRAAASAFRRKQQEPLQE